MDADLHEDLEIACMDALRGDPPGPAVASRVQLAVIDVLRRHGHRGARVEVRSDRRGTFVQILLPKPGRRVEEVVLRVQ